MFLEERAAASVLPAAERAISEAKNAIQNQDAEVQTWVSGLPSPSDISNS